MDWNGCFLYAIFLPSLYDNVTKAIAAVTRWCSPAHVNNENKLFIICSFHKHPHKQNVPGA